MVIDPAIEKAIDLDGEPLTPVIFPEEAGAEMSEEEMEALESGDDVRSFQSKLQAKGLRPRIERWVLTDVINEVELRRGTAQPLAQ